MSDDVQTSILDISGMCLTCTENVLSVSPQRMERKSFAAALVSAEFGRGDLLQLSEELSKIELIAEAKMIRNLLDGVAAFAQKLTTMFDQLAVAVLHRCHGKMAPEKMIQSRFADSQFFRTILHAGKLPAFQELLRPCENRRRAVPRRIQARHMQQKRISFRRQFRR